MSDRPSRSMEAAPMIVVRRITDGIYAHFPIRFTEWIMAWPSIGMGLALTLQDDMFQTSPSYATVANWADESVWAMMVLICASVRLLALIVNGTFRSFRYSPHVRLTASLVGMLFWSQFAIGFLSAAIYGQGALSAVVAYSTLLVMEFANFYRSLVDVLRTKAR